MNRPINRLSGRSPLPEFADQMQESQVVGDPRVLGLPLPRGVQSAQGLGAPPRLADKAVNVISSHDVRPVGAIDAVLSEGSISASSAAVVYTNVNTNVAGLGSVPVPDGYIFLARRVRVVLNLTDYLLAGSSEFFANLVENGALAPFGRFMMTPPPLSAPVNGAFYYTFEQPTFRIYDQNTALGCFVGGIVVPRFTAATFTYELHGTLMQRASNLGLAEQVASKPLRVRG